MAGKSRTKSIGKVLKVKKFNKSKAKKDLDILWSKAVRSRDKKCMKCGSTGSLNAHHVFGRRNQSTRWVLDNGITLCMPCHIFWAHRDVGSFISWWISKHGQSKFDQLDRMSKMSLQDKVVPWETIMMTLNNSILTNEFTDGRA